MQWQEMTSQWQDQLLRNMLMRSLRGERGFGANRQDGPGPEGKGENDELQSGLGRFTNMLPKRFKSFGSGAGGAGAATGPMAGAAGTSAMALPIMLAAQQAYEDEKENPMVSAGGLGRHFGSLKKDNPWTALMEMFKG